MKKRVSHFQQLIYDILKLIRNLNPNKAHGDKHSNVKSLS